MIKYPLFSGWLPQSEWTTGRRQDLSGESRRCQSVPVSYSIYMLRFVDGEVVTLDAVRLRQMTEPYVVDGGPEEGSPNSGRRTGAGRTSTTRPVVRMG